MANFWQRKLVVDVIGLEPTTSSMWTKRSNQLSYTSKNYIPSVSAHFVCYAATLKISTLALLAWNFGGGDSGVSTLPSVSGRFPDFPIHARDFEL